ncbi:mechanosensitive ion channel [Planctomycetales bacterium ZRK34]|nr:mechanosensitive ion channel [Planctomycetales bacterium ZRK34]
MRKGIDVDRPKYEKILLPALFTIALVYLIPNVQPALASVGIEPTAGMLTVARRAVGTTLGLSIAWLCCVLIDVFVWQAMVQRRTGQAAPRLLVAMLRVVVMALAISFIVAYVFEQPLTGVLVSSGVVGIVLGFALQRTISDFFSGIAMNVESAYRLGDWIEVDGVVGRVVEINWRATHLLRLDQVTVILPNSYIAERPVNNYNLPGAHFRAEFTIGLEYGVPIPDARRVLLAGARSAQGVMENPSADVLCTEFGNDSILYRIRFYVASYAQLQEVINNVALSVNHHIYQAGMSVPFPKRDVFIARMPPREIDRRKDRAALLARIELFSDLSSDEISRIAAGLAERKFTAGQLIVSEGDPGTTLYVVVDGLLEVRVEDHGQSRKVARLEPGHFFGEMSLLTGEPRSATIVSVTGSTLYELDRDVMAPILQDRPELAETLSRALAERKTQTETRLQTSDGPSDSAARRHLAGDFLRRIQGFFGLNE